MLPVLHSNQNENNTTPKQVTEIDNRKLSPQTELDQGQMKTADYYSRDGSPDQYTRGDEFRSEVDTSWQYKSIDQIGRSPITGEHLTQSEHQHYKAYDKDDRGEHNPLDIDNIYESPGARLKPDDRRDRDRVVYPTEENTGPKSDAGFFKHE